MKEILKEELEKYEQIYKGLDYQLCVTTLADIIAYLSKEKENEKGEKEISFEVFDDLANGIKRLIIDIKKAPEVDIIKSLEQNLKNIQNAQIESSYCIRTLTWVLDDVLKGEEDKNA